MSSVSTARALLGLAVKDLRLGAVYLWAIVPVYLGYGAALFLATGAYYLVNGVFVFGLVVGLVLLDARHRADLLLLSLPVTRRTVVIGRYLAAAVLLASGALLCFAYAQLLGHLLPLERAAPTLCETLQGIGPYAGAALLFLSVFFPLYYRLGPGKALYALAALLLGIILAGVGVHALAWRVGHGTLAGFSPGLTLSLFASVVADARPCRGTLGTPARVLLWTVGLAAALALSAVLSVRAYRRREL